MVDFRVTPFPIQTYLESRRRAQRPSKLEEVANLVQTTEQGVMNLARLSQGLKDIEERRERRKRAAAAMADPAVQEQLAAKGVPAALAGQLDIGTAAEISARPAPRPRSVNPLTATKERLFRTEFEARIAKVGAKKARQDFFDKFGFDPGELLIEKNQESVLDKLLMQLVDERGM